MSRQFDGRGQLLALLRDGLSELERGIAVADVLATTAGMTLISADLQEARERIVRSVSVLVKHEGVPADTEQRVTELERWVEDREDYEREQRDAHEYD